MRCARPSTTAVLPTPGSPMSTGLFFVRRRQHLHDAADLGVAADDRVEPALARGLGEVDAVLLQRLVRLLRVAAGDAPHRRRAPSRTRRRSACGMRLLALEQVGHRAAALGEADEQVLGGDVLVADLGGGLLRRRVSAASSRGESRGRRRSSRSPWAASASSCSRPAADRAGCAPTAVSSAGGDALGLLEQRDAAGAQARRRGCPSAAARRTAAETASWLLVVRRSASMGVSSERWSSSATPARLSVFRSGLPGSKACGRRVPPVDLDTDVLLLVGLAVLVGAAVQGCVGLGLGLVAAPVMALLEPSLVPATILLTTSTLPVLTAVRELGDVDWSGLRFALGGRLPGVVLGSWVVVTQPARTTALVVAVVVLGAVVLSATSWHARPTPRALLAAGVVSGVSGTATSIGGPPVAMLYQRAGGSVLRSTMGVYFLVGNVLSVGVLAVAGQIGSRDLLRALALLPFLVAGFGVSGPLRGRVDGPRLRVAVLGLSAAGAVVLLVRTLLS